MTPVQKRILIGLTIAVAITRWWAMSATIWDWDEALFASAVRSFDVVAHHPHPPGFPLYILLGKFINLIVGDEFRSLQVINFLGAVALFPALFFFAREMGFSFATSIGGALICVFAPNIWFFGGTAFSDVPSLTLVVIACALLLRAWRRGSAWAFVVGATILGVAAGFRPQNLAIGFFPFVLAAWTHIKQRSWLVVAAAGAITVGIVVATYVGAGLASYSWKDYQLTLKAHREYIVKTDSFLSNERPPLRKLFDDFYIRQFQFRRVSVGIFALSVVSVFYSIFRFRKPTLILLLTFGPFALVAWLTLDFISVSRFSIGYLPLFAFLGADGMSVLASAGRLSEQRRELTVATGSVLIALAFIVWAAPAITEAHRTPSPPLAAVKWIRRHISPENSKIFVGEALMPQAEYLLPDYNLTRVRDERAVPLRQSEALNAYVLAEGATSEPSGFNFLRSRSSRLWRVARRRYFEISVIPLARRAQFLDGWHEAENEGAETWRWMGRRSVTILPSQAPPAELRMTFGIPLDVIPVPMIRLTLNGKLLDEFRGTPWQIARTYRIPDTRADAPNELVIETDKWVNPKERGISDDGRDLGLRLQDMSWGPVRRRATRTVRSSSNAPPAN